MKKIVWFFIIIVVGMGKVFSQGPQGFKYQAVVRSNGQTVASTSVSILIKLLQASSHGTLVYSEVQKTTTNQFGLINLSIGEGTSQTGNFSGIDWSAGPYFLETDIDLSGGTNYQLMGTVQLLSVPFALYSNKSHRADQFVVEGNNSLPSDSALFVVKDKKGQVVFAVYETGVEVSYNVNPLSKGAKGGFTVGGRSPGKGELKNIMKLSTDSIRMYVDTIVSKGSRGGFSVGGRSDSKGESDDYFSITSSKSPQIVNPSRSRIFWYPRKEAFLTGRVLVESPDSVGTNSTATGFESKAIGNWSQALGYKTIARQDYSTAIGKNAIASGQNSFAFGDGAKALNNDAYAFGAMTEARGIGSFAFGYVGRDSLGPTGHITSAAGDWSFAFGLGAKAINIGDFAIGVETKASGGFSTAMGYQTIAKAWDDLAMGDSSIASGGASTAMGYHTQATSWASMAVNHETRATGSLSFAGGLNSLASGPASFTFGFNSVASGWLSLAYGDSSFAIGSTSMARGYHAIASGWSSFSSGDNTLASGNVSVAIGNSTKAVGDNSFAGAWQSIARGRNSFAFGFSNLADSSESFAIGNNTKAIGWQAFACGTSTQAIGFDAVAFGNSTSATQSWATAFGTNTVASGTTALAFGDNTIASGTVSAAFGSHTEASAWTSTTFGQLSKASGNQSFAAGYNTMATNGAATSFGSGTLASGPNSFAIGSGTVASGSETFSGGSNTNALGYGSVSLGNSTITKGNYSIALGMGTIAKTFTCLTIGTYNDTSGTTIDWFNRYDPSDPVFVVGDGESDSQRNNAFTVLKNANVGIAMANPQQRLDIKGGNGRVESGYNWLTNSDIRYKKNITTLDNSLEKVLRLRGVRYDLKNDEASVTGQGKYIGFIAQELEAEFPEFVVTTEDGYKAVAYDKLGPVLVQSIKEQQVMIESLLNEYLLLKNQNKDLLERLDRIEQLLKTKDAQ
jgi:hypothetical protein